MVFGGSAMAYLTQISVSCRDTGSVLPALLVMGLGFGMIFAPAINTATAGVSPQDSGVASALVNTMQQVGGSIGTAALSTVALTATASYLTVHHTGRLAPALAAVHGYTMAFTVSAALFALGALVALVLLPSWRRLEELRSAALAVDTAQAVEAASAMRPAMTEAMSTASALRGRPAPAPLRAAVQRANLRRLGQLDPWGLGGPAFMRCARLSRPTSSVECSPGCFFAFAMAEFDGKAPGPFRGRIVECQHELMNALERAAQPTCTPIGATSAGPAAPSRPALSAKLPSLIGACGRPRTPARPAQRGTRATRREQR